MNFRSLRDIWEKISDAEGIRWIDNLHGYQNTLRGTNKVNTQAALARKLGFSRARLTQIMNILKLAPEIKSYIKKLDEQEILHYFNEKRLRPIAAIQDEKIQVIEFKKIKKAGLGFFRSSPFIEWDCLVLK